MQERVNANMITTLRFFVGFLSLSPLLFRNDTNKEVVTGGIEVGLWYAVGFVTQGIALQTSSASKASFICALGVVVAPVLDALFPQSQSSAISSEPGSGGASKDGAALLHRVLKWSFLPSIMACIGAAILEFGNLMEPAKLSDALLFIPPIAYSIAVWRCEKISRKLGNRHQPLTMTAYVTLTGFVASALYATLKGVFPLTSDACKSLLSEVWSRRMLMFLFYEGCLATAAVSIVEQYILRRLSAAEVTLVYSMEPLFATLTSIFFGERLSGAVALGATFILSACAIDSYT
jgi:drug/metabolite transporter (DMT)-like permease